MSANVDGMVKEATRLYRANRKEEARTLLMKAVELDERHELAWMWLSAVVDSAEDQMICLENVLEINPQNVDAQRGLDLLKAKQSAFPKGSNPFTNVDDNWGDIDADTSGFMSDLDLGIQARTPEPPKPSLNDLRSSIDENYQTGFESDFDNSFFDEDYDDEPTVDEDFNEAELAKLNAKYSPTEGKIPPTSQPPQTTPKAKPAPSFGPPPAPIDEDFEFNLLEEEVTDTDERNALFELENLDAPQERSGESDDALQAFFAQIPTEIRPTRVPGADERYSPLLILLLALLVLGNIGAAALLVLNMA